LSNAIRKGGKSSWNKNLKKGDFMEAEMKEAIEVIAEFLVDILKK
jgi:hypothetical protein